MERLEVSCAVRLIYTLLGAKGLKRVRRKSETYLCLETVDQKRHVQML